MKMNFRSDGCFCRIYRAAPVTRFNFVGADTHDLSALFTRSGEKVKAKDFSVFHGKIM